mgnify:CR=1 FL=1
MISNWIKPDWPAPSSVQAIVTTRVLTKAVNVNDATGYDHFNLATHVGDVAQSVSTNRQILAKELNLDSQRLCWLNQVHGTTVVDAGSVLESVPDADGSYTEEHSLACIVMTADCLPVFLCTEDGSKVAAIHAGWRGLHKGILTEAVSKFSQTQQIFAWLGPAIGSNNFEVGADVLNAFITSDERNEHAFEPSSKPNKWIANIYQLARHQLETSGVTDIYGGDFCTYSDSQRFYSYRRDGAQSGRMASLIYKTK